jgi:hypothetical protein
MKTGRWMFGLVMAGCVMGWRCRPGPTAEVSDADFNALKEYGAETERAG